MIDTILIVTGSVLAMLGIAGILWCMWAVAIGKRLGDVILREKMKTIIPINLGSLGVATIGLLCVVVGIMLR